MTLLSDLLDFILPRYCHLCGSSLSSGKAGVSDKERFICSSCLASLPRTNFHRCPDNQMEMRFAGRFPFERASGHFFYAHDSGIASLIHDFKYRGFPLLAEYLGEIVASELFTTSFFTDIDVLAPIPMHFFKQARRGYNQAMHLARGIAKISGLPVVTNLKSSKTHRTQTSLTLEKRLDNMKNIFAVKNPQALADKHILLVDDVCTTGATLASAASSLIDAVPSCRLSLLTLAVTT